MPFEIGQRVRALESVAYQYDEGAVGTIIRYDEDDDELPYRVSWDGADDTWAPEEHLTADICVGASTYRPRKQWEVGDRIRVQNSPEPHLYKRGDFGTVVRLVVDGRRLRVQFDNMPPRQDSGEWWINKTDAINLTTVNDTEKDKS